MTEYICKEVQTDNGGYLEPVKELIRCKDCKYWRRKTPNFGDCMNKDLIRLILNGNVIETDAGFYCAWAERKEE